MKLKSLRIGQRVRIVNRGDEYHGRVGTVREVLPADPVRHLLNGATVVIHMPDGTEVWYAAAENDLRPAAA